MRGVVRPPAALRVLKVLPPKAQLVTVRGMSKWMERHSEETVQTFVAQDMEEAEAKVGRPFYVIGELIGVDLLPNCSLIYKASRDPWTDFGRGDSSLYLVERQ